ncbi:MAG TPA: Zn-binding domain-containing protein, partial [Bacillota bacterium]|nr:Zn-binding domain-containing protein [Bacillota bacterium]
RSGLGESVAWARRLLQNGVPTIVFSRSRLQVELILTHLRRTCDPRLGAQIRGYRGGYLPRERRAIERGLRDGSVQGVVSTNALELGIDIGSLQAAVLNGYPGSIASTWQQAGRAGRRQEAALTVFVAGNGPLDQYLVNHPEYLLDQPPEAGFVNPENLYILMNHLKCAAFELPFHTGEAFGPGPTADMLGFLADERVLRPVGGAYHWMADHFPANDVSLRGGDGNVVIVDRTFAGGPRVIGEIDRWAAMLTVYEEAIYLHEGVQYQVEAYDDAENKAYVREVNVDYYTDADLAVHLKVLDVLRAEGVEQQPAAQGFGREPALAAIQGPTASPPAADDDSAVDAPALRPDPVPEPRAGLAAAARAWGEVLVTAKATVYKKIKLETHENIGWGKIHLPERELHTTAYWLTFPAGLEATLGREALGGGLAGIARALAALAPLHLLCDPADVHAVPQVRAPFTGVPTIFLWEAHAGGVGLAEKAYEAHPHLLAAVAERIAACPCTAGCPSCTGAGTGADAKAAALAMLRYTGVAVEA